MFQRDQYELLDFGNGVKIERFGSRIISRQTPSVDRYALKRKEDRYKLDAKYVGRSVSHSDARQPCWLGGDSADWTLFHGGCHFELRQTPTGQVGIFPEQAANWDWIQEHAELLHNRKAINLFAYTGGSTMALANAGAKVVHVDSAASVVNWAKSNAGLSGLRDRPIRWIVDDAMKFLKREVKRASQYDILVADPPSFGRGKKNETWKIERDLDELVSTAAQLCPRPVMLILSCHTTSFNASGLVSLVRKYFPAIPVRRIEGLPLHLETRGKRILPSGYCARYAVGTSCDE